MKRPYLHSALVSEESKQCEAHVSLFSITGLSSLEKTLNSPLSETRLYTDILEHHTYAPPIETSRVILIITVPRERISDQTSDIDKSYAAYAE